MTGQVRSFLFAPGHEPDKVIKALASDADCVVVDLEDAVPTSQKSAARQAMLEALRAVDQRQGTYVRINGWNLAHTAAEDLVALDELPWVNVIVPMVDSPDDLARVAHGLSSGRHRTMIALVETAAGIRNLEAIADADVNLTAMILGQVDLANDVGVDLHRQHPVRLVAGARLVLAARAAGLIPLDGPFLDVRDQAGCQLDSVESSDLGFRGRVVLHPAQLDPVHRGYGVSPQQRAWARAVVEAFEAAEGQGRASITVGDDFVDYPVYKRAQLLLDRDHA